MRTLTASDSEQIVSVTVPARQPGPSAAPLALYALTGFSGLLAEQGFEKYIALLVGATASASAVVLFTYFLGFALGGVAAAWFLKQHKVQRPLLAYGVVELLVGISCVLFAYSFHGLTGWMAPLQNLSASPFLKLQVRFLCGCLLVLPAAALMGASFPLIAAVIDGPSEGRNRWPQAYSANLAGALGAAFLAPLVIMPVLGLRGAMWLCFAITGAVFTVAAALPHRPLERVNAYCEKQRVAVSGIRLIVAASFASGAVFFALEVIWTHLIGVVIGCSVYAFSWMLAAVLMGLLFGALLANRRVRQNRVINASILFQAAAILLLLQFRLWDRVPSLFAFRIPEVFQDSFYFAEAFKFGVTVLLLVPASTVLGLIYPRLLASPHLQGKEHSYLAGYLSAANALGCLTGALLGTFVLVPLIGSEFSLKFIVLGLTGFGILLLRHEGASRKQWVRASAVAIVLAGLCLSAKWDWGALTAGTGNYFGRAPVSKASAAAGQSLPPTMIFRHEDLQGGVTTIIETNLVGPLARSLHTMSTNGKFQGDDNVEWGDHKAQFGFSAVPSLFVNRYDRALLIGLGTGHSAATLRNIGYRQVEISEFAAGIVKGAREHFGKLNENVLSQSNVTLHLEDGRNVLLTGSTRYDLITIEITSIWFAGATNLYSREFYELARKRLNPDGVLQQWVQLHHVSPAEIASEIATVRSVFPYAALWYYGHQGMLVAANKPLEITAERLRDIGARLQRTTPGLTEEGAGKLAAGLEQSQVLDQEGITRFISAMNPTINTDHNRSIEYSTPRYQGSSYDWVSHNMEFLSRFRR